MLPTRPQEKHLLFCLLAFSSLGNGVIKDAFILFVDFVDLILTFKLFRFP